ncbi:MAG: outer membrane protein assembly factor BamE [Nitrococcus sp.]|nr:outer membrane protein assembly factor BamE [Nitrococcus sp.]
MRTTLISTALLYTIFLPLSGCSLSQLPFVYRPALEQGTVLSKEKIAKLRPGMTPQQVKFLLGTPTIQDPFHAHRWDYVYLRDPRDGGPLVEHRLTLFFDQSQHLEAARGYALPPESALRRGPQKKARLSAR